MTQLPAWLVDELDKEQSKVEDKWEQLQLPLIDPPLPQQNDKQENKSTIIVIEL